MVAQTQGAFLLRKGHGYEVHVVVEQALHKLRRVVGDFHAKPYTDTAGKVFSQIILEAEATATKFKIGIGTGESDGNKFTRFCYLCQVVVQGECVGIAR